MKTQYAPPGFDPTADDLPLESPKLSGCLLLIGIAFTIFFLGGQIVSLQRGEEPIPTVAQFPTALPTSTPSVTPEPSSTPTPLLTPTGTVEVLPTLTATNCASINCPLGTSEYVATRMAIFRLEQDALYATLTETVLPSRTPTPTLTRTVPPTRTLAAARGESGSSAAASGNRTQSTRLPAQPTVIVTFWLPPVANPLYTPPPNADQARLRGCYQPSAYGDGRPGPTAFWSDCPPIEWLCKNMAYYQHADCWRYMLTPTPTFMPTMTLTFTPTPTQIFGIETPDPNVYPNKKE